MLYVLPECTITLRGMQELVHRKSQRSWHSINPRASADPPTMPLSLSGNYVAQLTVPKCRDIVSPPDWIIPAYPGQAFSNHF